jgi:hypothetical protein
MSQREVERLIGRLITDEDFRRQFERDPRGTLRAMVEREVGLTAAEVAALAATPRSVWHRAAQDIDPRLQKASLKSPHAPHAQGATDDDGVE